MVLLRIYILILKIIKQEDKITDILTNRTHRALLDGKFLILKPLPNGDHAINYKVVHIPHKESDNLFLGIKYNLYIQ